MAGWTTCNCASSRRLGSSRRFLRGRSIAEVPDITARICGICPVAYQMSACHALEALLGVALPEPLRALRRLLYCGEWIESHVLHIAFLHAPDFLGYESAFAMAQDRPEYADKLRDALQLKKAGNAIVDLVGGRAIHPINVRLGGFYRVPGRSELAALAEQLKQVQEIARELVRWTAGLDFPPFEHDYEFVALRHESDYPMNEGRLVSNRGLDIAMDEFPEQFEEYQVPYSNALQCRRKGRRRLFRRSAGALEPQRRSGHDPRSRSSPARPASPGPAATLTSASSSAPSKPRTRSRRRSD